MEYWLAWIQQGNEQMREIAVAAERMGFTGVCMADHVAVAKDYDSSHPTGKRVIFHDSNFPDPLITFATMAAVTTRLRFMTYVYILPMREPFTVAKQVATLAMQSDYRFSFGTGAGWNAEEFELLGQDPHTRGQRMDEMLSILRDLWEDGVAEFSGKHYRFGPTGEYPVPAQRIPIWIGGASASALKRAARHDGWLGMNQGVEDLRKIIAGLHEERRRLRDAGLVLGAEFQTAAIAEYTATPDDFRRLEEAGVRAMIVRAWRTEGGGFEALQPKLDAMAEFCARHDVRPA
jgi:probable F420-dependent oxidoreductase